MLRFLDAANALSLAGLMAALACAILGAGGRLAWALVALMVSGLCDLFDGFIARRLERTDEKRRFGGHLDSVVDACCFGLAPAVFLHGVGLRTVPELLLIGLFLACAVWRLAYYETVGLETEGAARYYHGLPVTFAALVLPLACLAGFWGATALRIACGAAAFILAAAMVCPFRLRKPGGAWYAFFLLLAAGLISLYLARASSFPAP